MSIRTDQHARNVVEKLESALKSARTVLTDICLDEVAAVSAGTSQPEHCVANGYCGGVNVACSCYCPGCIGAATTEEGDPVRELEQGSRPFKETADYLHRPAEGQSAEHEPEWVVTFEFVERDNAEAFSEDLMLWLTDHVPAPRHFQAQAVREIRQQLGTETVCPRYWLYEDASPSIGPAKEVSGPDHDVKSPDGNAARASAEPAVPSGDRSATGPSSDRYPTLRATRGVQSGDLCVGRTRIPTASLWGLWENRGLKPGDVQALYPDLTIDEVEWAMEYERRQRSYHGPSSDAEDLEEAIGRIIGMHDAFAPHDTHEGCCEHQEFIDRVQNRRAGVPSNVLDAPKCSHPMGLRGGDGRCEGCMDFVGDGA